MIIQNYHSDHLNVEHWEFHKGQCWAVLGRNGSGKRMLGQVLSNNELASPLLHNEFSKVMLISFEQQQAFYENELKNDDTDFMDHFDTGTTVRNILALPSTSSFILPKELEFLNLNKILDRGYRLLSSGESRKVLLAQALLQNPKLLILDEPYDSLDIESKRELSNFFQHLIKTGDVTLLFLLNTTEEIFPWHSHVGVIEKGEFIAQGSQEEIMSNHALLSLLQFNADLLPEWPTPFPGRKMPELLVSLNKGEVHYGDTIIFQDIHLQVTPGQHTLITGANGSGKSTLLDLISGDHPQCYGNDLKVLGFQRGSGESIWEIKKQIGIVSPALHRNHRVPGSALHIVLSGFFDSIGLYEEVNQTQIQHAKSWLGLVGLNEKVATSFKQLSYGEQRLALIARALVKQPALLLLDEPTQGLDDINRHRVMYFLEHLSSQQHTTIVMASHRLDEHLPLFQKHLQM